MNWRKILAVATYEFRTNFRRGGYLFATFGLPLLALALLGGIRWISQRSQGSELVTVDLDKPIGVVDEAHFLPALPPEGFEAFPTVSAGRQALLDGHLLALVVIPPDYPRGEIPLTVYTTSGMFTVGDVLSQRLTFLVAYGKARGHIPPQAVAALFEPPEVHYITISTGHAERKQTMADMWGPYTLSILYFMALFSASGYLLQGIAEEKESRIVEVLLSSVTAHELLWGKMLGLGALGLTQMAIWVLIAVPAVNRMGAPIHFQLHFTTGFLTIAAVALVEGFLLFGLLMAGLGALGNNMRESQQFSAFISMLAVSPMILSTLFFLNPNGIVPRVMSYIPWTAPVALLLRLSLVALPWWEIAASLLSMAVGVALSLWAGVRLFRVGILMFGKRPSWKEVWRILRQPA